MFINNITTNQNQQQNELLRQTLPKMRAQRYITEQDASNYSKDRGAITYMRQNIRELNRSMESIQKMIQRSRQLINKSRQASLNSNSLEKYKENRKDKNVLITSIKKDYEARNQTQKHAKTVHRQIDLSNKNQNTQLNNKKKIGLKANQRDSKQISFRDSVKKEKSSQKKYNPIVNNSGTKDRTQKATTKSKEKSKQKHTQSPFKKINDKGNTIYKFSPQKTNTQTKSIEKNKQKNTKKALKTNKQQYQSQPQTIVKQQSFKIDLSFLGKNNIGKQNILIEEEESQLNSFSHNKSGPKEYRFKTQYTPTQLNSDIYSMYKLEEPSPHPQIKNERRKINLKLFQSQSKKSCLASQRSKKSTYQSVKLSTRKILVKQLGQLETQSTNEEQRKAKFILKIKKYGFVEKHLSQQQIWNIYDQLVESNIPELKWPIVIVDQVYRKMKLYQ